jgi:hypothetical protein
MQTANLKTLTRLKEYNTEKVQFKTEPAAGVKLKQNCMEQTH